MTEHVYDSEPDATWGPSNLAKDSHSPFVVICCQATRGTPARQVSPDHVTLAIHSLQIESKTHPSLLVRFHVRHYVISKKNKITILALWAANMTKLWSHSGKPIPGSCLASPVFSRFSNTLMSLLQQFGNVGHFCERSSSRLHISVLFVRPQVLPARVAWYVG